VDGDFVAVQSQEKNQSRQTDALENLLGTRHFGEYFGEYLIEHRLVEVTTAEDGGELVVLPSQRLGFL
jgi:hypothetical protein